MSSESGLLRPHNRPRVPLADLAVECGLRVVRTTREASPVATSAAGANPELPVIRGIAIGSASVEQGDLFVALSGLKTHGVHFAADALARGAVAVLTDPAGVDVLNAAGGLDVPLLVSEVADLRAVTAQCAAFLYGNPSADIRMAGITGTNGKTTSSFFLDAIARAAGERTGLLGTVEIRLGEDSEPSERTTVEAPVLQGFLARCKDVGTSLVTMEVSSHALALSRVRGTHFKVVGFTNLQHDHLDFHHTMEEYFEAKAVLFSAEYADRGVIVADDSWSRKLAAQSEIPLQTISTPLSDDLNFQATWKVVNVRLADHGLGLDFDLEGPDGARLASHSPLLGDVNVSNAALASIMARDLGYSPEDILRGLTQLAIVPGRMEVVSGPGEPLVIVDYAHTTEALEFALRSLRASHHAQGQGKLIGLTGSAGERDATKRPAMGRAVFDLADIAIITDDDPYSEDMSRIRSDLLEGITSSTQFQALDEREREARVLEIAGRGKAIEKAIELAKEGDTVLLAGRGHETIQEINGVKHHLDDRAFAREVLRRRRVSTPQM